MIIKIATRKSLLFAVIIAIYGVFTMPVLAEECQGDSAALNLSKANEFLLQNKTANGVVETDSGLQYIITQKGTGTDTPRSRDDIVAHYELFNIDKQKIESSRDRGLPLQFRLNEVIKGWREAVSSMTAGEKRTLFVKPELGYGCKGSPPNIGANELLIFNIEIVAIVKPGQ